MDDVILFKVEEDDPTNSSYVQEINIEHKKWLEHLGQPAIKCKSNKKDYVK